MQAIRPFNHPFEKSSDSHFKKWLGSFDHRPAVEIGCGAGLHPIRRALRHPEIPLLAFERTKLKFRSFQSRIESHKPKNLFALNRDATCWLPHNMGPRSVSEYFFLYPNPYPKESQANKRWHRSPFFHFVLETLAPGGHIHFASNETFYIEECKSYSLNLWKLELISEFSPRLDMEYRPVSHFEKKYLQRGETCTHLTFKKIDPLNR